MHRLIQQKIRLGSQKIYPSDDPAKTDFFGKKE
jgi:hypothetical protein